MNKLLFLALSLAASPCLWSQEKLPAFGKFLPWEIALNSCSFDPDASAVVLFDDSKSTYDLDHHLVTDRRVRIKILNQQGLGHAQIEIPYYAADQFEKISQIEAITFNPDISEPISKLEKKDIYKDDLNERISVYKFAFPNVRPGSIIEYRYTSQMANYGGVEDWYFQRDIPTITSRYSFQTYKGLAFGFFVHKKPEYKTIIREQQDLGKIDFRMDSLPGLRNESFMDAASDYLQRVVIKLTGYQDYYLGRAVKVNRSWIELARELAADEFLGSTVKKKIELPDALRQQLKGTLSQDQIIQTVYRYMQQHFAWNGLKGKYASDGLKKIAKEQKGSAGELNLLLLNWLTQLGIEATPLLVAERHTGQIDLRQIMPDKFNKTVVLALTPSKEYILDLSQRQQPAALVPASLLNTYGLPVSKKTEGPIYIDFYSGSYKQKISVAGQISKEGLLDANVSLFSFDYAKTTASLRMAEGGQEKHILQLQKEQGDILISDFKYTPAAEDSAESVQRFRINRETALSGGYILYDLNLFSGLRENPFASPIRFSDINFGYPYDILVEQRLDLAEGIQPETLPADTILYSTDSSIILARRISIHGQQLKIKTQFVQQLSYKKAEQYGELRDFYIRMLQLLTEKVVLKVN